MSARRLVALVVIVTSAAGCAGRASKPPASPADADASPPARAGTPTAGWVLVAVGGLAGTVALGTSAIMLHEDSVRADECDASKSCSPDGLSANERLKDLAPWNAGAWVTAGAALGGGLFLVLSKPKDGTSAGLAPGPGGAVFKSTF